MYHEIEGGAKITVEGLTMWLPPTPPHHEIANWNLPKDEQFWRRTPLPDWYEDKFEEEEERREALVEEFGSIAELNRKLQSGKLQWEDRFDYVDKQCEAFRKEQWRRRMEGYWFYNNGVPTYLTGPHYFYLNWIKIDIGYPHYYDFSREAHYFFQYCEEDPKSLGYCLIGPRGIGKTVEQLALQLEKQTRKFIDHTNTGLTLEEYGAFIQSKTTDDAKDLFEERTVNMFLSLPHFFKPIFDVGKGTRPSAGTGLVFQRASVTGKKAKKVKFQDGEELKSFIKVPSSVEKGADGKSRVDIFTDEIGKTEKRVADVYKRALVNKDVVFRNNRKYGIQRAVTTVEEMDKGGRECLQIWENSDQRNKSANGLTVTGMYRIFLNDIKTNTQFIDKFGVVDEVKAKAYHEAEKRHRKDDPNTLADYLRKHPEFVEEAFYVDAKYCPFNQMVLQGNLIHIAQLDALGESVGRFRLDWVGKPFESDVVANRDKLKGHWYLSEIPPKAQINQVRENGVNQYGRKRFKPLDDAYCAGTDPIDLGKAVDEERASIPAIAVKKRFNPRLEDPHPRNMVTGADLVHHVDTESYMLDRELLEARRDMKYQYKTGIYTGLYAFRPSDPNVYFEEVCKACRYWGMMVHVETQRGGSLRLFLEMMGYQDFISNKWVPSTNLVDLKNAEEHSGTAAGVGVINSYINRIATFVEYFGHTLRHSAITKQLLKVNPGGEGMRRYDIAVAVGYCELEDSRPPKAKPKAVNYGSILPKYQDGKMTWGR